MAIWWGCISKMGKGRSRKGGTDEQPLSDKPPFIRCEETHSERFCVKKMKEKCVTFFCFIKLSAKVSAKLSGDFSMQKLGLFFQS